MEECRRMGVNVLGPDVNESRLNFTVNANGDIRFGLGAIRGIGEGPVEAIIQGRAEGRYTSIFDFSRRVNFKAINRTAMQNLVYAGGFDSFSELHRAQYFMEEGANRLFLDHIIRYGTSFQDNKESNQHDLFGEGSGFDVVEPKVPSCEEWSSSYKLAKEREVIGIFISGHPLDDYKMEIDAFCTGALAMLHDMETYKGRDLLMAVVVTSIEHRIAKNGDPFGTVIFEDYTDQYKLNIFRENYLKFKHLLQPGVFLTLRGRIETPRHRTHLEFNLNEVELLQHLREKRVKGLHLSIPNKDLNHLLIDELNGLFLANQGSCNVQFTIFDAVEGLELNMASKSVRVNPDPELYKALSKMNIQFRLN
jgi:DNA polymerase-3 subunit alpha